jgi:hypothetical protein
MSRRIALENIQLQPSERIAHTEYSLGYHPDYLARRAGTTPDDPELESKAFEALQIDFIWSIHNGPIDWKEAGRVTDMGHAAYAVDGSDQRRPAHCPFASVEEVYAFDAVEEYGMPDFDELVRFYEDLVRARRRERPGQLTTGGYYRTIVSGAIDAFGWDMLLQAAADPERMEPVWDSFFRRTLFHMKAWAETSIEALIQHDDFVWTAGPFMRPEIYRSDIIPRYAELWKPVREAGKKLLFCSDGNFELFAEDVVRAGADGLIFEPCNDFGRMAERFGRDVCLVGSFVDCRDLTFGRWDKVRADIDRTLEAMAPLPGAIFAVGNHLAPNIPPEMLDRYFDYLLPRLART